MCRGRRQVMQVVWIQKYEHLGFAGDPNVQQYDLTKETPLWKLTCFLSCKKPELEITSLVQKERY